jgi:hypothetical protein
MMPSSSPALQQVIGQLLAHDDWSSQDSEELTARAARVYDQFTSRLTPFIGEAGVRSIFTRSATLMQADFAFLTESAIDRSVNGVPTQIWKALKGQEPAMVRKALEALLTTFAGLLINLIGERLAWRFLFDLSPEAFSSGSDEQERTG